jgi:hypothetical protein
MANREIIVQKCYAIVEWARVRGEATLKGDEKKFAKADVMVKMLVDKLCELIKNDEN